MKNLSQVRDTGVHTEHKHTFKCSLARVLRKTWRLCCTWQLYTTVQDVSKGFTVCLLYDMYKYFV